MIARGSASAGPVSTMNNPTFSETVARFKELGGRIVINGDVATTIDHIRTFFKKHGYAIEGDTEVEPTEPMVGSLVSSAASVVDRIMDELTVEQIRTQIAERGGTVPGRSTPKRRLAEILAVSAGYSIPETEALNGVHLGGPGNPNGTPIGPDSTATDVGGAPAYKAVQGRRDPSTPAPPAREPRTLRVGRIPSAAE